MKRCEWVGFVRSDRVRVGLRGGGGNTLFKRRPALLVDLMDKEGHKTQKTLSLRKLSLGEHSGERVGDDVSESFEWYETEDSLKSLGMVASMALTVKGKVCAPVNNYSLENMLPLTEKECQDVLWFASSKNRFHDKLTLKWVSSQVFQCDLADAPCRVNAKVISLYKCIELGEKLDYPEFERDIAKALQLCKGLGRTSSSKTDEFFLRMSILTVSWHVCINMGWYERAEEYLNECAYFDYSGETKPPFALNIACAKLIIFAKRLVSESPDAAVVAKELRELFYYAVSLKTNSYGWFGDYGTIHRKAMLAFSASEKLKKGEPIPDGNVRDLIKNAVRVSHKEFIEKAMCFVGEKEKAVSH